MSSLRCECGDAECPRCGSAQQTRTEIHEVEPGQYVRVTYEGGVMPDGPPTGPLTIEEQKDAARTADACRSPDGPHVCAATVQTDRISKMPGVADYAGVGDGTVADAVTALIGRLHRYRTALYRIGYEPYTDDPESTHAVCLDAVEAIAREVLDDEFSKDGA